MQPSALIQKSELLLIDSTHYTRNATWRMPLQRAIDVKDARLFVRSASFYNSTPNISAENANQDFNITWIDGTVYSGKIPRGYYDADSLTAYLSFFCAANDLIATYSEGNEQKVVTWFTIQSNTVRYGFDLTVQPVPAAATATAQGWSTPAEATWSFPTTASCPTLTIGGGLQKMLGFKTQTIFPPAQTADATTFSSDGFPRLSPTFAIHIGCNLCYSMNALIPTSIAQIPLTKGYGELVTLSSAEMAYSRPVLDGQHREVEITLYSQDGSPLQISDTDLSLVLEVVWTEQVK